MIYQGASEKNEQPDIIFDPFIKFIIMFRIDTMISVVYCRLSGHNVDDRLPHTRTLYSEIIMRDTK